MLEQVGECFEPVPRLRTAVIGNSRVKALTYYGPPGLDDDRILAVYALRCAFAHDYGLNHMGLDKQAAKMRHTFMLRDDDAAPLSSSRPFAGMATTSGSGIGERRSMCAS
jgi:hypothetical protein